MQEFVQICLELAREAFGKGEVPVGCVVAKDGKVIAKAHNRVEELKDPTAHAEMLALREAMKVQGQKYLYGCEVYVSLEPCPMCAYAMVLARVERVVFLATDERYGAVMSRFGLFDEPAFNHRVRWEYLPVEEAGRLLKEFFRERRL
ncbi:MAG: nucleoside deaminase [Aquificaceae bacterium]|uniref:nucleoside deaminase n=1 Tax=Hydrogenobacter sp. Uz 6-8 TaxID=3384828 RepID=UPI000F149684|nr:MAG: nucleoside deaminase [Aquificota bacterium]